MKARTRTFTHRSATASKSTRFDTLHPNAAGLDIGSVEIWAAVPADRDEASIRRFGTFTPDLVAGVARVALHVDAPALRRHRLQRSMLPPLLPEATLASKDAAPEAKSTPFTLM